MTAKINDVPSEIAEAVHTYDDGVVRVVVDERPVRHCVVVDCELFIPCPDHGVPVEDRGQWLWSRH